MVKSSKSELLFAKKYAYYWQRHWEDSAMNRDIGASFGLAALLVVLLHPVLPEGVKTAGAGGPPGKNAEKTAKSQAESASESEPVDGPWLVLRSYFNAGAQRPPGQAAPSGCDNIAGRLGTRLDGRIDRDAQRVCIRDLAGLPEDFDRRYSSWSIVATVTDPLHTRIGLMLDRQLEAIQAAADSAGWTFAGQWLPWRDRVALSDDDVMKRRHQRHLMRDQESMPGILLFRRSGARPCAGPSPHDANGKAARDGKRTEAPSGQCRGEDLLTVFLVGETPTTGVPGTPFRAALNLASVLVNDGHSIGLLGPNYSGSLASLAALVREWQADTAGTPTAPLSNTVHSGSVSNRLAAQEFIRQTKLGFQSGIADSPVYTAAMNQVIARYKVNPAQAARLVEYGTAFGSGTVDPGTDSGRKRRANTGIRTYRFPLGISQLRNAYPDQPAPNASQKNGAATPGLSFTLHDTEEGEDIVPEFSKQTPSTQDALLTAIMEDLRRWEIRLVDIVATNPMDTLFLSRVVKSKCPDARILIENAEVLAASEARQDPLRGTLFLSTYPMSPRGEDWLQKNDSVLLFPGPDLQGVYNALGLLLRDLQAIESNAPALRGWATPAGGNGPGIWLLTLTRSGFMPLDLFESANPCSLLRAQTPAGIAAPQCSPAAAKEPAVKEALAGRDVLSKMPPPPESWVLATVLLFLASLAYCCGVVLGNRQPAPGWLLPFGMGQVHGALEAPIFNVGVALSSMLGFLSVPFLFYWWAEPAQLPPWTKAAVLVSVIASLVPPLVFIVTRMVRQSGRGDARWWSFAPVAIPYASLAAAWVCACFQGGVDHAAARMFVYRALELPGCVSPAIPMLVTCFALGVVSVTRVCRYIGVEAMQPSLEALPRSLRDRAQTVSEMLTRAPGVGVKQFVTGWFPLAATLVALPIANMDGALDPFDQRGFVWAIRFAAFWLLWLAFHYCQDLVLRWRALKALLIAARAELTDLEIESYSVLKCSLPGYFIRAARQIHNLAFTAALSFVALVVFFSTYSSQAPNAIARRLVVLFLGVGILVTTVLVSLEKDYVLSKVRGTEPHKLNIEFWLRLAAFGALPLLGLVAHLFPEIAEFVSGWVQPSVEALR